MTAALAGLLAGALVVGAVTARPVLLIAVVLVQGAYVGRWFAALQARGAAAGIGLAGGTGLAADLTVLASDEARPMGQVPAVLGVALLGALAVQLFRRDGRADLTASLIASGSAVVISASAAGWLALQSVDDHLVLVAVISAAAVPVLDAAPRWFAVAGAVIVAGTTGLAVAAATDLGVWPALGCAAAAAVTARVSAVFAERVPSPAPALTASLPLVLAAPVAYVVGRVLVG